MVDGKEASAHGSLPAVTCLCPTYGRFERLRDALACFLLQDYPRRRLLILNDGPPLELVPGRTHARFAGAEVRILNRPERMPTLGHKRQLLLEQAQAPVVAHWDDDDLYLPWHLGRCVEALRSSGRAACVKPDSAWYAVGPRDDFTVRGVRHNIFEGQMVFRRRRAVEFGGYPPQVSGQARALLEAFQDAGELKEFGPEPSPSYVYRWGDGLQHISARGDSAHGHRAFGRGNRDFGDGRPLLDSASPLEWAIGRLEPLFKNNGSYPQISQIAKITHSKNSDIHLTADIRR